MMFENNPGFFMDWVDILLKNLKSDDLEKEPLRFHLLKIKVLVDKVNQKIQ